jgi:glutathione S-transferase
MSAFPILYSFRRCPYAIRARMALFSSGLTFELREVLLRDKPASMLSYSPKGTVPVLVLPSGQVIDESLDVMNWALQQSDPDGWLDTPPRSAEEIDRLLQWNDGEFKSHLDRYKYSTRYEDADPQEHRDAAEQFLTELNRKITTQKYLAGDHASLVDIALFPFIRQLANTDREWFDELNYEPLQNWLEGFLSSERFAQSMRKFRPWQPEDPQTLIHPELP